MSAGRHFAEGFHRLTVFTQINALGHDVHGTELIDIHDEFLVGRGEPAFHPAGGVKHKIRACQQSRHQGIGALVSGLSVGKLRSTERSARAEWHFHAAGELGRAENGQRAFRCAKGRRARLHRECGHKSAKNHRRAGAHELHKGRAGPDFGQNLRERSCNGHRAHRTRQNERGDDAGLIVPGIDFGRAEHRIVPDHRRIGVDEAGDDGVVLDEFLAEQDFREVHRILRPIRMGNGAHIGFVGIAHVRINHLQVALVDGKIDRLADRAAGMVH